MIGSMCVLALALAGPAGPDRAPRDEAFKNFADRADIDSIRTLCLTLVQADTFGTSIGKTLRIYSDTLTR